MQKSFVVGIAGSSGSGKTLLLQKLKSLFNEDQITVISQDDYYIPANTKTQEENRLYNFDLPTAIDRDMFYKDIQKLLQGETVLKTEYTFNNPKIKPKTFTIKPAPVLVVEGLFIFHYQEVKELIDYSVFIDAEESIALKRRIERDFIERGYSEEDVLYKWINHVIPAFKKYLLPFKNSCDMVIDNSSNEIAIINNASTLISQKIHQTVAL
ncbi:MAG TPA: uridine-cytidine kinase [Candidatus Sphingobacterium stercoripullorum]|nr:uridine-cytidine kinase [Candidatus Sphingobacterium stercoripullorum]